MSKTKEFVERLLVGNNISITSKNKEVFEKFIADATIIQSVDIISKHQIAIMEHWKIKESTNDILDTQIQIPNGTVGKPYHYKFDFEQLNWNAIQFYEIEGLDQTGLMYDKAEDLIYGNPTVNGDFKINLHFRVKGENENSPLHVKRINLIINANPKSLWKNLESNQADPFWKEDNVADFQKLGEKNIVVASKRGRSHANVGSFRDDDFAFHHFQKTGWSVVAVADGAGSAKNSRKGAEIACNEVMNFFEINFNQEVSLNFDELLQKHDCENKNRQSETQTKRSENIEEVDTLNINKEEEIKSFDTNQNPNIATTQVQISKFIYKYLGACAKHVHNKLEEFALKNQFPLKELHSTLIFSLFKKYDFGYVILSFGVGDCPIAVINKDFTDFKLMNWLDVGDFGGGTRFITMPEIFTSDKFSTRFGFKIIDDFSFLILMTDGIYDAKFVVEANLEKLEKWKEFVEDLKGNNEESAKVDFEVSNTEIANQLSSWMDFWSPGNHDDRTLAIIF
jgi:serine/threonine protein phosphatase PrpC